MNMQTTIKVRTANKNALNGVGKHLTLTRIENTNDRIFGFAITDEGDEVYIPAAMIRANQMTSADSDAAAGFTCPIRNNPRANDTAGGPLWVATNPLTWDGEAEEITVDVPDPVDDAVSADVENELVKLADAADDMVADASDKLGKLSLRLKQNLTSAAEIVNEMSSLAQTLGSFRAYIDEVAPRDD